MDKQTIIEHFSNKIILITGGLGSIGSEIINQLKYMNPKKLIVIDNRETELNDMYNQYKSSDNIEFFLGDVRDKKRMLSLTRNVQIIFHAAALKHVLVCEYNPFEAVKSNIIGTQNMIECAIENKIEKFILISTDKAVNPTNMMGSSKLAAERLVSAMSIQNISTKTKFGVVRFGNVLASRGSVLEIWKNSLRLNEKISITDPNMSRFFMSIPQSVELIFVAAILAEMGEVFILKMPSITLINLAKAFLLLKNRNENRYKIIGKGPGEKMNEELFSKSEIEFLWENDDMYVRLNTMMSEKNSDYLNMFSKNGFRKSNANTYISDNEEIQLNIKEIVNVLKNVLI
ncbi:MAG: polysaccharide biosynthesis protein [Candidatus Heimdallarchaeota archaeon]|nr:polysaccharide biosynthesis protein [Candidatus Heimdallarchaeota archaeon]